MTSTPVTTSKVNKRTSAPISNPSSSVPLGPATAVGAAAAVVSAFLRDPSVESRSGKVVDKLTENWIGLANEPSLAFYRIQEHARKCVPPMAERKAAVDVANTKLTESSEDLHYGAKTVADLRKATSHFANLADLLRRAAFYQQQLAHLQLQQQQQQQQQTRPDSSTA